MDRLYRLLTSLGLLVASTFAVFAFLKIKPSALAAAYHHELRADEPFYLQYFTWLFRVLHGDLGWSTSDAQPVSQGIIERLPATLELALVTLLAAITLGALVGFVRARAHAPARELLAGLQLLFRALPVLPLAMLLQLAAVFSPWPPPAGISSVEGFDLRDRFNHLILPVASMAVPFGAWASLIFYDVIRVSDSASRVPLRCLAATGALTAALIGPPLLAACVMIEPMFAWPGIARLFYSGVAQADFGLTAGFLLTYVICIVLVKLCSEFALGIGDWRLAQQTGARPTPSSRPRRFSATGIVACFVLGVAALGAASANLIAPVGPYLIDQVHWSGYPLAPGVAGHPLGTDENGRDLLARLLVGMGTSLGIAVVATIVATAIGAVVAKATMAVTWFDDRGALSTAGIRPFAALPFMLTTVVVVFATRHVTSIMNPLGIALIIAAVSWPAIVPAFRALSLATLGSVVGLTGCALLLEVTLSDLGFGVQPPRASLGNMFANAQSNMTMAPWIVLVPSVVVVALLFALYAIADELHDFPTLPTETE